MSLNKVTIFLRKEERINYFRSIILNVFNSDSIDEIIICSGFFQEPSNGEFSASEDLIRNISNYNQKKIKIVGVHNNQWIKKFDIFCSKLKQNKFIINKFKIKNTKWHAKIMIAKKNGIPILTIIGSSNITRPAFHNSSPFNYESDVLFWDDKNDDTKNIIQETFSENSQNGFDIISSDYNPNDKLNNNKNLVDKIKKLEEDIFNIATEEPIK